MRRLACGADRASFDERRGSPKRRPNSTIRRPRRSTSGGNKSPRRQTRFRLPRAATNHRQLSDDGNFEYISYRHPKCAMNTKVPFSELIESMLSASPAVIREKSINRSIATSPSANAFTVIKSSSETVEILARRCVSKKRRTSCFSTPIADIFSEQSRQSTQQCLAIQEYRRPRVH
jgi:hypothetical protein